MDVKEAVKIAKSYVNEVFSDEGVQHLGLEEVERNDVEGAWNVTVGFSRPWNAVRNTLTAITGETAPRRSYKVVHVREADGAVLSVKKRDGLD